MPQVWSRCERTAPSYSVCKDPVINPSLPSNKPMASPNTSLSGKTTTTEFVVTHVGPSRKGPKTANPHDLSRTAGGSSPGSSAAVADLQGPIALGTQKVGSTIPPGSFNGTYVM